LPLTVKKRSLQRRAAASVIISTLHQAKQELASELEVNLKHLKSVLQETQRIAKEMEAVLREAKAEPDPREKAMGESKAKNWDPGGEQKGASQGENAAGGASSDTQSWEPPGRKAGTAEPWQVPPQAQEGQSQKQQ